MKASPASNSSGHGKLVESSGPPQRQYMVRREIDKSTTADSHISQLKMVGLEGYLRGPWVPIPKITPQKFFCSVPI